MRLIDNWKAECARLWSMRVTIYSAVFWSAITGLVMVWPAFSEALPLWFYAAVGVVLSIAIGVARLLKQPGAD